ncbi:hypothetical protein ACFQ4K_17225 [Tistrella bauzanensis]
MMGLLKHGNPRGWGIIDVHPLVKASFMPVHPNLTAISGLAAMSGALALEAGLVIAWSSGSSAPGCRQIWRCRCSSSRHGAS